MPKIENSILLKQVKLVNESLKLTILSSIVLGSVLALQIYKEFSWEFFIAWISILLLGLGFRVFLAIKNKTTPPDLNNINKWVKSNFINTGLSAIAYGIAAGATYWMKDQVAITIIYIYCFGGSFCGCCYSVWAN